MSELITTEPQLTTSLKEKIQMAQIMSQSNIVPKMSKDKPYTTEDIVSLFLIGERLGIDPISALSGIFLVEGRPTISARLSRALIRKNGHAFKVESWDSKHCKIVATRQGEEPQEIEYRIEEAIHAGLLNRNTWRQYPKQMLFAAATRRMVDVVFSDLFLGMASYDEAEIEPKPQLKNSISLKQLGESND